MLVFFHVEKDSAKKILDKCPAKGWSRFGIEYLFSTVDKTGSTESQSSRGRLHSVRHRGALGEIGVISDL